MMRGNDMITYRKANSSDIPEITEEQAALAEPVGDRFIELRRKNAMFINRLLNEYYAKKGIVL